LVLSDQDGKPVIGANIGLVELEQEVGGKRYNGVTGNEGLEEFGGMIPGMYELKVSHVRHESYRDTLELGSGERRLKRVTLAVETRRVEEVIVKDERNVTTGEAGVRSIERQDINRIPTASGGLLPYLRTLPSVETVGSRGGNLYVRGGKPTQNHVLVDGLPLVKPFHVSNIFSPIPSNLIESVDFYPGGFSAKYLEKSSSVMDIGLRGGNMKRYNGSAELSPYLSSVVVEGPITEGSQSFLVSARKSLINQTSEVFQDRAGLNFYDIIAKYSFINDNFNCDLLTVNYWDKGRVDPSRENSISWTNTSVGGSCLGFSSSYSSQFEIIGGYSSFSNSEYKDGDRVRYSSVRKYKVKANIKNKEIRNKLEYGFGLKVYSYNSILSEVFDEVDQSSEILSIFDTYVLYGWDFGNGLKVEPGVGLQIPMSDVKIYPEPRFRASYSPSDEKNQEISLSAGRYYQLSYGYNDVREIGDVFNLVIPFTGDRPRQSSTHGILGYERSLGEYVNLSVESYYKIHGGILVSKWTPRIGGTLEPSTANSTSYGMDVRVKYEDSDFYGYLGYGWSKVEYEASSDNLGAWIEKPVLRYSPAHDRRHRLNAVGSYQVAGYTVSLRWTFGSGRPYTKVYGYDLSLDVPDEMPTTDPGSAKIFYDRPYGGRLPTFHRLDVSLKKSFQTSSSWFFEAEVGALNVYDRENIFYLNFETQRVANQLPITPYVTLNLKYR